MSILKLIVLLLGKLSWIFNCYNYGLLVLLKLNLWFVSSVCLVKLSLCFYCNGLTCIEFTCTQWVIESVKKPVIRNNPLIFNKYVDDRFCVTPTNQIAHIFSFPQSLIHHWKRNQQQAKFPIHNSYRKLWPNPYNLAHQRNGFRKILKFFIRIFNFPNEKHRTEK